MKYFTIKELSYSTTAVQYNINNTPDKQSTYNLIKLVDTILDPLRTLYGKPIHVSSGFRCYELNRKIGGSTTSQHSKGMAADLQILNKDGSVNRDETRKLYDIIVDNGLPFDQLILKKVLKKNLIGYMFHTMKLVIAGKDYTLMVNPILEFSYH